MMLAGLGLISLMVRRRQAFIKRMSWAGNRSGGVPRRSCVNGNTGLF
jgi:hypothetical protein